MSLRKGTEKASPKLTVVPEEGAWGKTDSHLSLPVLCPWLSGLHHFEKAPAYSNCCWDPGELKTNSLTQMGETDGSDISIQRDELKGAAGGSMIS